MVLAHSGYVGAPFPEGEQERQVRVDELCLTSHGQNSVFDKLVELTAECLDVPDRLDIHPGQPASVVSGQIGLWGD